MKNTQFVRKFKANDKVRHCGKTHRVTHAEPEYRGASDTLYYKIHRGLRTAWVRSDGLVPVRG